MLARSIAANRSMVLFSGKACSNPNETFAKRQTGTNSPSRRSDTTKDVGESDWIQRGREVNQELEWRSLLSTNNPFIHDPVLRVRLAHIEVPALVLWGTTASWTSNIERASRPVFQVPAFEAVIEASMDSHSL